MSEGWDRRADRPEIGSPLLLTGAVPIEAERLTAPAKVPGDAPRVEAPIAVSALRRPVSAQDPADVPVNGNPWERRAETSLSPSTPALAAGAAPGSPSAPPARSPGGTDTEEAP